MRNIKSVKVGNFTLDGNHIYIQSMLNARSDDIDGNINQAVELEKAGCEIIRVAVPDMDSVHLISKIKEKVSIPLVADIHFDYRLALESAAAGADKIRINPGNIGSEDKVKAVSAACVSRNIPIRIGVNSGSLEKDLLAKYGSPCAQAMIDSAMRHIQLLNKFDFDDIIISLKASSVPLMLEAYRLMAKETNYPLHLGVTEAGTERMGLIKSSIGIGALIAEGVGETIRVSLTADPVREVYAARDILRAVGRRGGVEIISCPTCGRTRIDLMRYAEEIEKAVFNIQKDIKIAVMGCHVNGPGEAREADIGIAGGDGFAVLFKKGKVVRKISEENIISELLSEIEML